MTENIYSDFELIQINDVMELENNSKNIQINEVVKDNKEDLVENNSLENKKENVNSYDSTLAEYYLYGELVRGRLPADNFGNFEEIDNSKAIIEKKDEKIIFLENQIIQMNASFDKKLDEVMNQLKQLNNKKCKKANFVLIKNKWKVIDKVWKCCENNCVNTDNPKGVCIEGNGYINLVDDENINYINCEEGKGENKYFRVCVENSFTKPKEYSNNYSLFYFEIKCIKIETNENRRNWVVIGLNYNNYYIRLLVSCALFKNEKNEQIKLDNFKWKNVDVFGCGLVYPPTYKINKFPYIFFTQNGQIIGKEIFPKYKCDSFNPYIIVDNCLIEANFGNDLENKPFIYDVKKHVVF
uniref:SPRY domain-containing protein n=1 Tax=Meloidogyne incognita TaxID=6306 RepID=A0A914N5V1_MELIC